MNRDTHPRFLFVNHAAELGGAELSLLDIACHFRRTSRVVLLADGPLRRRLEQGGVTVDVLEAPRAVTGITREGRLLHDLKAIPGVLGLAWSVAQRARTYDVLYANSQKAMIVAAVAGLLARRPVIWHLRDIMTADHFSPVHRRLATLISNLLVTRVIANSDATRAAFIAGGARAGTVFTVHNGIRERPFRNVTPETVAALRQALNLPDAPVVGVFSRLAAWKGQHVLLEALRDLPEVHALLVGEALFQEDACYADRLREMAARDGLADRVHFLGFRDDVPALLHLVDAVVHTSTAPEPFGRVIVEGMLARRPVVATRAGGAVEIIDDGKTGILVPPGDVRTLTEALRALLYHPDAARRLAHAGWEDARNRFTLPIMLERTADHARAIIQDR